MYDFVSKLSDFKRHSLTTVRKKGKKQVRKINFLANGKSLNDF
jgi:hypothetical protein